MTSSTLISAWNCLMTGTIPTLGLRWRQRDILISFTFTMLRMSTRMTDDDIYQINALMYAYRLMAPLYTLPAVTGGGKVETNHGQLLKLSSGNWLHY